MVKVVDSHSCANRSQFTLAVGWHLILPYWFGNREVRSCVQLLVMWDMQS
jgi:hypothetical protein